MGTADCHAVDYRTGPNGYEVFVDGEWTKVPDDIVLRRHDNPTGGAVLCITHLFRQMLCFVPGTQMYLGKPNRLVHVSLASQRESALRCNGRAIPFPLIQGDDPKAIRRQRPLQL